MDSHTRELMFSSGSSEYETPQWLFDRLHQIFDFTIDPCASDLSHMLDNYWTEDDDGLSKDWENHRPYINPPYSDCKSWFEAARNHFFRTSNDTVVLTPVRSDTSYWHDYVWYDASYVLFIKGRLKFINRMALSYALMYRLITETNMSERAYNAMLRGYGKIANKSWKNPPELEEVEKIVSNNGDPHKAVEQLLPPSSAPFPSAVVMYTPKHLMEVEFSGIGKLVKI